MAKQSHTAIAGNMQMNKQIILIIVIVGVLVPYGIGLLIWHAIKKKK